MTQRIGRLFVGSMLMAWLAGTPWPTLRLMAQNTAPQAAPAAAAVDFTFSLYYTGNLRGNLEPCG